MAALTPTSSVCAEWLNHSAGLFDALKRSFGLVDTEVWEFSISSPDSTPPEADPGAVDDLSDLRGSTAFMLRRIQALRHLLQLEGADENQPRLVVGYASDLHAFISNLTSNGMVDDPGDEQIVIAAVSSTGNLVAEAANAMYL